MLSRPVRVRVACDPPILGEVVRLAIGAVPGVELDDRLADLVVSTTGTADGRTILVDGEGSLPQVIDALNALISQGRASDTPLGFNIVQLHTADRGSNKFTGGARSDR